MRSAGKLAFCVARVCAGMWCGVCVVPARLVRFSYRCAAAFIYLRHSRTRVHQHLLRIVSMDRKLGAAYIPVHLIAAFQLYPVVSFRG